MATFITSKSVGQVIQITVNSSTGYWKYNHNGSDSSVFSDGEQTITVANANGEFTLIPCLSDGTPSGDIIYINAQNLNPGGNQITSFDGTGLTSLTYLDLAGNQLTSFDGTGLTSLTNLGLGFNQLTSVSNLPSSLTNLGLTGNGLTSFDGTDLTSLIYLSLGGNGLTSFDGTGLTSLTNLGLDGNGLTSFDGTGLTSLTYLDLGGNQLISIDTSTLTELNELYLSGNQLTSLDLTSFYNLQYLYVDDNPSINTPTFNNSFLSLLAANELANAWGYGELYTTGGRTSAGTTDYDYLIANGWDVQGADLTGGGGGINVSGKLRIKGAATIG